LSPPGGVVTDEAFLLALSREMGKELPPGGVVRETSRQGSCEWLGDEWAHYEAMMKDLDSAEIVLIPWSDPVHAADGSLSRNFNWSQVTCPEPVLMVSEELARGMKLNNGDILPVKKTKKLAGKVVGATIHFPSVRKLFPWKLDQKNGEIELSPIPVRLSSQSDVS
jgi:TusA-related sulfurtransferase